MPRHIVLLRGINVARNNRISMPELRKALTADGFTDVATYVQSGNVLVTSRRTAEATSARVGAVIKKGFGLDVKILVRSRDDLAAIVRRNPLAGIATNPRRYLVTFLSKELPDVVLRDLRSLSTQETFAAIGREVYTWHPDGIGRTPIWERLASRSLGIAATSRNWQTVTALLAMADPDAAR